MGKSLIIEIDEATKGIMEDLQSSITANVKEGVATGLTHMIEDQQHHLVSLQTVLATKLSSLEDEVSNSKKPLSRLTRDVEDTLRVVTSFQASVNTKLEQVEQVQERHLNEMNVKIQDVFHKALINQQESTDECLTRFQQETKKANDILTNEVSSIKESFQRLFEDVTVIIHQQFDSLQKQQQEMGQQVSKLQSVQLSFEQLLHEQKEQFVSMNDELVQASMRILEEQQDRFHKQLSAIDATREDLVSVTIDAHKAQFAAIQQEQQLVVEQVAATMAQINNELLQKVTDPAPFEQLSQFIDQKTTSILNDLNQQPLVQKLEDIQKQLDFIRLPFHKKWFSRKGGEK
ncbi:hypothetical protein [Neobacillus vireti]|uniref:hypothetical protein n=1 Tax=Neobacillus vireti TaxID=220686 RepID=UPI003000E6D9